MFEDVLEKRKAKKKIKIEPSPLICRHFEYSVVASLDDEPVKMSDRLFDLALESIKEAKNIDLSEISERMTGPPYYPDVWPGEHYKLIASIVKMLKPKLVIEIGTALGLSALALKKYLPVDSKLVTFDIINWQSFQDTLLCDNDFTDKRLVQEIGDLSQDAIFEKYSQLIAQADFIFIDGPKDISFEKEFLNKLEGFSFDANPIIMFDDIKLWNMLRIWRDVKKPKIDLTSFGHWSGTGLIEWK